MDIDPFHHTLFHFGENDTFPVQNVLQDVHIVVYDRESGFPITSLDVIHERVMHVFITDEGFETFGHVHPEDFPNGMSQSSAGIYTIQYNFTRAGDYAIVADYSENGRMSIRTFKFRVSGNDDGASFKDNFRRSGEFDGYSVTLQGPEKIVNGEEASFVYHIEKDGEDVKNLEMFLGSEIHILSIRDDLSLAGHAHAYVPGHSIHYGNMTQRYFGPNIPVRYTFPSAGEYAIFGQFQHDGEVVTTKFMVKVEHSLVNILIRIVGYLGIVAFGIFLFRDEIFQIWKRIKSK
jgi:hypothetical protein